MDDDAQDLAHGYSIRLVTKLTGLNADTIRAWERRYQAVNPARTSGKTRRYRAEDVRRLSLLKAAVSHGHRIGDIARLNEEELQSLARNGDATTFQVPDEARGAGTSGGSAFEALRADYLEAIALFEARKAQQLLSRAAALVDPLDFVLQVVLPVMRETGDRWHRGEFTVAQEHLVSMQQRGLLQSLLLHSAPHPGAPRILVATPAGERHEFGALAGALLATLRGYETLYLGSDLPFDDLHHAVDLWGPDVVLLSVVRQGTSAETRRIGASIDRLARLATTWVGLSPDHPLAQSVSEARCFSDFADLDLALTDRLE